MFKRITLVLTLAAILGGCALPLVSEAELEIESEKEFDKIRQQTPISTDARARSYIECVARAIIEELEEPYASMEWEIEVFDSDSINAFAMTGGKIGVFTGIFKAAKNQDQLGAVLGHEVAHVTQKHALERVNTAMTTQGGVMVGTAVLGGGQATADVLSMGAALGITLPYGRGQESEADVVGLKYSAGAGFDPRQSVELWKNMEKANKLGPPEFLSTHPSGDTRISDLIAQLPESLVLYNEAKSGGKQPRCAP